MSLYEGSVKKPIMTSLCFVAVAILGIFSYTKLPIDLYPDIETNMIMVMTAYPGASAADVENNVTRPLENALNAVSDLKHITSESKENMSLITLEFEYGEDIDVLTNDVRDKLDMVKSELPDDSENPIIFKFSSDMIPIVILSVQANESMPALYKILDDNVASPLARISGVGSVSISGAPEREIQIYVDPVKLEAYNLSIETIASVIGAENRNVPGGTFDVGSDTYSLRVQGEFNDASQMNDIIVGNYGGKSIYLRDVAVVHDSVEERAQETYNNGVQGAMIVIQKQSGANSVEISNEVMKALPRLQKNLPSDVKLGVIIDTSDNIRNTIDTLFETVLLALLFVSIVVFFFLGRWRATIIIVITIPISLVASFIYLAATGNSLNIISLSSLSIAIGMVVDDAIVVLENDQPHRAGQRPPAGGRARYQRGGPLGGSLYAHPYRRVLPPHAGFGHVGRTLQAVGLDGYHHHGHLYRVRPLAYPHALLAPAEAATQAIARIQAALRTYREGARCLRQRLRPSVALGRRPPHHCHRGLYVVLRTQPRAGTLRR